MTIFAYPRSHILIAVTVSYIFGILISSTFPVPHYLYLLLFISTATAFIITLHRSENIPLIITLLFFLGIGHYSGGQNRLPPESPRHISNYTLNDEEVVLIGTIQRFYGYNGTSSRCDVEVHSLRTVSSNFTQAQGKVRFTLLDIFPMDILPGDTVAIRANLKEPNPPLIPGVFNYPEYLANLDIHVTGFISSPLHIQKILGYRSQSNVYHTLKYWPETLRTGINRFIDSNLEGDAAAIYKALLTGDRSSVSPQVIEHFKGAGVLHILAISGLHMSLLGVCIYGVFFYLLRRPIWLIHRINTRKTAAILCILPLLFYTLIAGAKTPVVRSFIMSLVVILAICYGRKHSFGSLLACAALVILLISPGELTTASFQLSFAAVLAIAAAVPYVAGVTGTLAKTTHNKKLSHIFNWAVVGVMISMAATLGTAPLLMYHFNRISMVGIAANLVVEPILCLWSLILGFIAIVFIFIWQPVAVILLQLGGMGITLANEVTAFFYQLPHSSLFLPGPSLYHLVLYYLCLCVFFFLKHFSFKRQIAFTNFFLLIFLTMFIPFKDLTKGEQTESVLSFLAVGHGGSTLIEMPGEKRILIDAGALSSPGYDVGRKAIAPFLLTRGITRINDIVITHPDSDHYNGAAFLIKHFNVDNIWISTKKNQEEGWQELLSTAVAAGTQVIVGKPQQYVASTGTSSLKVLTNTAARRVTRPDNDLGLVLKYSHKNFSVIFPGDISAELENDLIQQELDVRADILLASHHGSASSNSRQFLETVEPRLVLVSSGRSRSFAFPSAEVTRRCRQLKIPLIPLNRVGTVTIATQGEGYSLKTYLQASPDNTLRLPPKLTRR